ncbi:MAG: YXWGXW repeat-containing protein [Variovorax sp.]|nr:YXWGXW repeat-containing protein [Variovorax sp.]
MRLSSTLLAYALAAAPFCASAQVSININVPGVVAVAPPAPRYEPVPPPRVGYVWVPGVWQYRHDAYAWQQGYWQPARPDYVYAPGRWVRAEGGWRWVEPEWKAAKYKEPKGHRHDHHHDYDDDHYHCPPGQAKKGRC